MAPATPKLFTPLRLGALTLSHRVVLAPLTRCRSAAGEVPTDLMAEYYSQRSTEGGLLISEATQISQEGQGMSGTPGMYTPAQVEGWKKVTAAVHAKGGLIFAQLWHMGRQSHSSFQPNGGLPVAPSAVPIKQTSKARTATGEEVPFETPRALETSEIPRLINDYVHAATCAKEAGFDGIEVHSANGYLLNQFLHEETNKRTDNYGGSIPNRARLTIEVIDAVVKVWGSDRVGVRFSPPVYLEDSNKEELYRYILEELNTRDLSYVHFIDPLQFVRWGMELPESDMRLTPALFKPMFNGVMIGAAGFDREKALEWVEEDKSDAIAFGALFIANPDLPRRLKENLSLNAPDYKTYFTPGPKGYTDYPFYSEEVNGEAEN